jgi:hypothetical protein
MRIMQSILSGAAESPSTAIPRIAVPAATNVKFIRE